MERTKLLLPVTALSLFAIARPSADSSSPRRFRCGNVASILQLDENLTSTYLTFDAATQVRLLIPSPPLVFAAFLTQEIFAGHAWDTGQEHSAAVLSLDFVLGFIRGRLFRVISSFVVSRPGVR